MQSPHDVLESQVERASVPVYLSTKSDIVDYAKDNFGANWATRLAELTSGSTDHKSRAYKSARRNFEGGRENTQPRSSKDKAKWVGIGKQLPPIGKKPPKNGYKVTFNGKVKVSSGRRNNRGQLRRDGGWAKANFSVTISGNDAYDMMQSPSFEPVFSEYFTNFDSNPVTEFQMDALHVEGLN